MRGWIVGVMFLAGCAPALTTTHAEDVVRMRPTFSRRSETRIFVQGFHDCRRVTQTGDVVIYHCNTQTADGVWTSMPSACAVVTPWAWSCPEGML